MKNEFRILLIDDKAKVLEELHNNLDYETTVEGANKKKFSVKNVVKTLQIELEQKEDSEEYQITSSTIDKLADLCKDSFDYIISDFAFIGEESKNVDLRARLITEDRDLEQSDFDGWLLQLNDIKKQIEKYASNHTEKYKLIDKNFLSHSGNIQIYTFSPYPFNSYFSEGVIKRRKKEIKRVFPNAKIDFLLMHEEFSITQQIENKLSTYNGKDNFYSRILGKRLSSLIETIILRYIAGMQQKFFISSSIIGFRLLVALGLIIGILSSFSGDLAYHFLKNSLLDFYNNHLKSTFLNERIFLANFISFTLISLVCSVFLIWFAVIITRKTETFAKRLTE